MSADKPGVSEIDLNSLHALVDAIPPEYRREAAQVLVWLRDAPHRSLVSELIRQTQEAAQLHIEEE